MANILSKDMLLATGRLLKKAADAIGVLLFLFAFSGFIVQIFYRYVMNAPLLWTEEVTMIAFIWTVFWAAAFMTPIQSHVSFDVVYDIVNPKTRRIFCIISMLALFISFVLLVPATWDYLQFLTRKKSSVLRLPHVLDLRLLHAVHSGLYRSVRLSTVRFAEQEVGKIHLKGLS